MCFLAIVSNGQKSANDGSSSGTSSAIPTSIPQRFSNLAFHTLVLLQTIGDIFTPDQLSTLKHFVHAGGGIVALHGAAAGMPNDPWYGSLIGAHFGQHPPHEPGIVLVEDANQNHVIMNCCGGRKDWADE